MTSLAAGSWLGFQYYSFLSKGFWTLAQRGQCWITSQCLSELPVCTSTHPGIPLGCESLLPSRVWSEGHLTETCSSPILLQDRIVWGHWNIPDHLAKLCLHYMYVIKTMKSVYWTPQGISTYKQHRGRDTGTQNELGSLWYHRTYI